MRWCVAFVGKRPAAQRSHNRLAPNGVTMNDDLAGASPVDAGVGRPVPERALQEHYIDLASVQAQLGSAFPRDELDLEAVRRLMKHAERYVWLRDQGYWYGREDGGASPWVVAGTGRDDALPIYGDEVDAAVDAGMAGSEPHNVGAELPAPAGAHARAEQHVPRRSAGMGACRSGSARATG